MQLALALALSFVLLALPVAAQSVSRVDGTSITCSEGDTLAVSAGTWACATPVSGGGLPAGALTLVVSGTCPTGYVEETTLDGVMLRGTLAANADVGTTGGADTITPAGTNSVPTFAGAALGTHSHTTLAVGTDSAHAHTSLAAGGAHAHELPMQQVNATTMRLIASSAFGNGTSRAAVSQFTTTSNATSAAVMLAQSVTPTYAASATSSNAAAFTGTASASSANSAGTPIGTVTAPTFTGTQFDNRPAFTRVIFCRKT